jgi:hypothetical protein
MSCSRDAIKQEPWVSSRRVEFSYLLIKRVLKGSFEDHHRKRLETLDQELGREAVAISNRWFGVDWGGRIVSWLGQADWEAIDESIAELKDALREAAETGPLTSFRNRYRISFVSASDSISDRPQRGDSGPDGSGKTTLIRGLARSLGAAFRRTDLFHFRPGLLMPRSTRTPVSHPHAKPPRSWLLSFLKNCCFLLDYWCGYLLDVRPKLVRSSLVLFDRYYDDLLVDPRRFRFSRPPWLSRTARPMIPRPDLLLFLDARVAHSRKAEVSPQEVVASARSSKTPLNPQAP